MYDLSNASSHESIDLDATSIFSKGHRRLGLTTYFWQACILLCVLFIHGFVFGLRKSLNPTSIRWHHAAETVKMKLRQGQEVQLANLCKSVTPSCYLNPLLRNRHLQTIWFMFDKRKVPLYFQRILFKSEESTYKGTFAVDMIATPFNNQDPSLPPRTRFYDQSLLSSMSSDDSRPMLIVLHGLCGGSHELYLQHVLAPLVTNRQSPWEACVILSRGCGQSSITDGGMYHASATSDIRQAVLWLQATFPNRPLYAAGFSMGANILTRYLAEEGEDCVIKAAVVVSNPWNLEVTALHLQHTFLGRWLYSPSMTAGLMAIFSRNKRTIKTIDGTPLEMNPDDDVQLLYEYDRHIQCRTWGFPTERAYYRRASSSDAVLDVRIPFWAINAEDDPIVGQDSIPTGEFHASPYTVMCTTSGGGHLGWFQSGGERWYAKPVVAFMQKMQSECLSVSA